MAISWYQKAGEFKSPKRVVAAFLLRSRQTREHQIEKLKDENERLRSQLDQQSRLVAEKQKEVDSLKEQCDELGQQFKVAQQSVNLPQDQPIGTHGYGLRMISLAINLGRSVGFRGAHRVLKIFSDGSVFLKNFHREHRFATGFSVWGLVG